MLKKLFLPALIMLLIACQGKSESMSESEKGTLVDVVKIDTEMANSFLEFSGVLQPISQVNVFPEAAGKIEYIRKFEGDKVNSGDVLAHIEDQDYQVGFDQANAAFQLATANLENATSNFDRQAKLKNEGFASQAALEGVETAYKIASAQADQAEAAMKLAKLQLARTYITTPISAYIFSRAIEIGQFVSVAAPAYVVQDIHRLKVNLSVNEFNLMNIGNQSKVVVRSNHLPHRIFYGKVAFISQSASADGGFPLRIELDNSDLSLLAGWTVSIEIYEPKSKAQVAIPGKAMMKKSGHWVAYTVKDGIATEKKIDLTSHIREKVYVRSGLDAGELVIVNGQEYCKSGEPVELNREWTSLNEYLQDNQDQSRP